VDSETLQSPGPGEQTIDQIGIHLTGIAGMLEATPHQTSLLGGDTCHRFR
jgi:hypothetical protein